jgi:PAS domain S-box-containing protein
MGWLACGVIYSAAYIAIGWLLRGESEALLWFRLCALLIPPLAGVVVIVRRRNVWTGCQWLFWATIALGLVMSAIGLVGWTVHEFLLGRETSWLGWHTVFTLFGAVAPLFALLAQPHRGSREAVTASTAVDIAGIAVMTGFLYSRFVIGPDMTPVSAQQASLPLILLAEFQQLIVVVGMLGATWIARGVKWGVTYRRLAIGLMVNAIVLTIANLGIWQGLYRSGFVYDVIWIMPYAFFPWAAALAPTSAEVALETERHALTPSRPWVIFSALGLIPLFDYALRQALPLGPLEGFRDLSTAITIFSVLPLLMARLTVEHGEAQQANRKRRLLAAATEQADELISIMRPDGGMEHANDAFCRAMGYQPAEVVQMVAADFVAEHGQSLVGTIAEAVRSDGVWRGTLVRRRRDSSTFLTSCTVTSLADDAGRVTQLVGVERDITRETELRDQLIHAERLAAAGQLVSGVAHELNNPLQSVVGFTELLLASEQRHDARGDLERILSEAHRAAKIVRNLLTFVRRSGGERTSTHLNDLVQSVLELRSYEFGVANIAIVTDFANDLPPVPINREEIKQVLLNLVLNAEHAMKTNGAGTLRVRTMTCDAGVAVEVHDDGPGVPPTVARRIFEPFFSTKEVGEGTGLGLSIALGIAEAHGGTLVLADASQGARFRLTLPTAAAPAAVAIRRTSSTPVRSAISGQRALVADDEKGVRMLLQRMLTQRGFAVDVAVDGEMASTLVQQSQYDVILCDVKMPRVNGLALYERIRRQQPDILDRFIFVSGDILNPQLRGLSDSSQILLLSKPFDGSTLDKVLAEVIARRLGEGVAAHR